MKTLRSLLFSIFALSVVWPATAAADWLDDVEIKVEDLGGGIYVLFGAGGNIGISVGDDGVFMIDDQYGPLSEKIQAALASVTDQPVNFIINTHWHGDHTGGNETFGDGGAIVVAHDKVRERMKNGLDGDAFGRTVEPSADAALPMITFSKDTTFYMNGDEVHVLHVTPSHTDGDSVVFFKDANVVHMGDTFFHTWNPFVDFASGGNLDGMIAVHKMVLDKVNEDTKIIPGHGPMAEVADLRAARDGLKAVRDLLEPLAKSDKSIEDIVASKPMDSLELGWTGFLDDDRFVSVIVAGMRAK